MDNITLNLNDEIQFKSDGIYSKVLLKTETSQYSLMCLAAGTDIEAHTSAKNAGVLVVKGCGTFELNGQQIPLVQGTFIHMPANTPHALKADQDLAILLTLTV